MPSSPLETFPNPRPEAPLFLRIDRARGKDAIEQGGRGYDHAFHLQCAVCRSGESRLAGGGCGVFQLRPGQCENGDKRKHPDQDTLYCLVHNVGQGVRFVRNCEPLGTGSVD